MPAKPPEYPVTHFPDVKAWADWLEQHHATAPGVWLRLAKKGSTLLSPSYAEALDVALCFGWIDSQKKAYDTDSWIQKFTPRGAKSLWSKLNREKVEALQASGRMRPPGQAAVEAAQRDGRWARAYDSPADATVPVDFQAALDANPAAAAYFAMISKANRYAILFRVQTAVRAETRARRVAELVAMLARGETIHS